MENLIDDDIEVQQNTSAQPQTRNMRAALVLNKSKRSFDLHVIHHDFITVETQSDSLSVQPNRPDHSSRKRSGTKMLYTISLLKVHSLIRNYVT